jgi:hypothetical protein
MSSLPTVKADLSEMMFQQLPSPEKPSKEAMFPFKPPRVLPRIVALSDEPDDLSSRGWLPVVRVRRCTENGEAPGSQGVTTANIGNYREYLTEEQRRQAQGSHAAPALGWRRDASPFECSRTFTTGC